MSLFLIVLLSNLNYLLFYILTNLFLISPLKKYKGITGKLVNNCLYFFVIQY